MVYTPPYVPWRDLPNTTTPITANALGIMDQGIIDAHAAAAIAQATAEAAAGGGDSSFIIGLALDGVTDDGPAIQAALEDVEDGERGAHLLIHGNAGKQCYINSTITISKSQTILDADVELLFGPDGRIRPWGIIDEQPILNTDKPALTSDAASGATVLNVTVVPAGWGAGDYVGIRGKRTASGAVPNAEIFHSYVQAVNVGAKTITLVDPLPKEFKALWDTPWSNKLTQVTKVTSSKLTGTPQTGDVTITIGDSSIFEVGDIVQILDNVHTLDDGGDIQDGNFAHKETAIIAEIPNGTSLKLSAALEHTYVPSEDAHVQKLVALEDCELRNFRIRFKSQGTAGNHAIEVRYAHNTHVVGFSIAGTGDDGPSWSGHAIRFTDSLACSATRGVIANPSDVTAGRGYGVSWYGSTRCWVDSVYVTGCRHSFLWFNGASATEARNCISTDARISDYDWHGADCANNRTSNCTATGGTRSTADSNGRTAWKWGNPSHRPGDRGNVATDCLVVNYQGTAIEGIPDSSENIWQGVVRGATVGIKLGPLAIDDDQPLGKFIIRDSEFFDVTTPFSIDGGPEEIVTGFVLDNTRWHRSGPFVIENAPGARFTRNQIIAPTVGSNYPFTANNCDGVIVKGNDFSGAPRGMQFTGCANFRATNNDLHDLAGSTIVYRDGGGNTGYLFRDNDYVGYTPTASYAGTPSAGTLELTRATGGGGGGGGTYPPTGGVPFADLDSALAALVSGAYQLPGTGIPASDLASAVSASLDLADTAYQKPPGGIPNSDLATPGGGGGGYSADLPSEHTYAEWNYDPTIPTTTQAATAGRLELMRVRVRASTTKSQLVISVGTAAAGMTAAYVALFDAATGNQLAITADVATTLSTTGVKKMPTTGSFALVAGQDVYVGVLCVGGTPPALHRAVTTAGLGNAGLNAAAGYRFMSGATGLTSMPSTITVSAGTSSANTFWTAIA